MTAIFEVHVDQRIWRGYDDPGLPSGMWVAQGAVTGDATGGLQAVQCVFRQGGVASGRFFNIEQIEVFHSSSATKDVALIASNWDRVSAVGLINKQWRAEIRGNANGVSAMSTNTAFPLPIFLGVTAVVPEIPSQVQVSILNVDLTSLVVTIQGYTWGPRSVMAEGGLRRPADSLFGGGV